MFGDFAARFQRRSELNRLTRRTSRKTPVMEGLEERRLFSTAYALFGNSGVVLAKFDTADPDTIVSTKTVDGLPAGMGLRGIDFRPSTGQLFALGIRPTGGDDEGQIFTLDLATGDATAVGPVFSTSLSPGATYGFDFNPAVDRIRIFNGDDQNLRVNPFTGFLVQFDTPLDNPNNDEEVTGGAYDRNISDVMPIGNPQALTTLFGIDFINDTLVRIGGVDGGPPEGSPNAGVVTEIGSLGITTGSSSNGFDIDQAGDAFALLNDADTGLTSLYSIDLTTGEATAIDTVNNGAEIIRGFAIAPDNRPPKAVNDVYQLTTGGSITRNAADGVLKNDSDPDGDSLTAEQINSPNNGVLLFNSDGSFTYTPSPGFTGTDSFSYVAHDGLSDSTVTSVTFNVIPTVSVSGGSTSEGNAGQSPLDFTINLNGPFTAPVVVNYRTNNGSAGEGDYVVIPSGSVTFAAGETSKVVSVQVKGDTKVENDETFQLRLTSATNAVITGSNATGTILNDDMAPATPKVFISDASVSEGQSGTKNLAFTVFLDGSSGNTIKVNFATQNFTAGEGDYGVKSGTLTFSPGQTSKQINIVIKGDTKVENNEQFRINLSNLVNVQAGDLQALGTIINDD